MRATGYINRASDTWNIQLCSLTNIRLFLVARPGPSVFVLKDEEDNTFKSTLGNPHKCTCGVSACVHVAFCIIKVLKVPKEHPLSFQTSLTDNELDLVLSGSLGKQTPARTIVRSLQSQEPNSPPKAKVDTGTVPRQPLSEAEEENTCTICQDDMKTSQPLTWCRHGCGNNFHAQCMMKFAQHKITNRQDPSCPLCRELWDMALLKLDCRVKSAIRHPCASAYCINCTCRLHRLFHRCLECSQKSFPAIGKHVDFCPECFLRLNDSHRSHHFITSDASIGSIQEVTWHPANNPNAPQTLPPHLSSLQHRDLSVNDYDLLLQLDQRHEGSICSNLLDCLPAVSIETVRGNPIKYGGCICSKDPTYSMLLLPCGHIMHRNCLKEDISGLAMEDIASLAEHRCAQSGCGKVIFPSLRRRKKPKQTNNSTSSSNNSKSESDAAKSAERLGHLADSSTRPQQLSLPQIVGAGLGERVGTGVGIAHLMPIDQANHDNRPMPLRSQTIHRRFSADNAVDRAPSLSLDGGRVMSSTLEQPSALPLISKIRTLIPRRNLRGIGSLRSAVGSRPDAESSLSLEATPILHPPPLAPIVSKRDDRIGNSIPLGGIARMERMREESSGHIVRGIGELRVVSTSMMKSSSDLDLQGISTSIMDSMTAVPTRKPPQVARPSPLNVRRSLASTAHHNVDSLDSLNRLLLVNHR